MVSLPAAISRLKNICSSRSVSCGSTLWTTRLSMSLGRVSAAVAALSPAGPRALDLGDQPGAVVEHGGRGGPGALGVLAELAAVVVERGVGPAEQPVPVVLRDAEQVGDGLQRQLGGDVDHQVTGAGAEAAAMAAAASTIGARPAPQLVLEGGQRARRHRRGEAPADLLVARVVHHVQQHAGREPAGQVLDEGAPGAVPAAVRCPS